MAKCRYDMDYMRYGFSYTEDNRRTNEYVLCFYTVSSYIFLYHSPAISAGVHYTHSMVTHKCNKNTFKHILHVKYTHTLTISTISYSLWYCGQMSAPFDIIDHYEYIYLGIPYPMHAAGVDDSPPHMAWAVRVRDKNSVRCLMLKTLNHVWSNSTEGLSLSGPSLPVMWC